MQAAAALAATQTKQLQSAALSSRLLVKSCCSPLPFFFDVAVSGCSGRDCREAARYFGIAASNLGLKGGQFKGESSSVSNLNNSSQQFLFQLIHNC
jgi:hypothetical protein